MYKLIVVLNLMIVSLRVLSQVVQDNGVKDIDGNSYKTVRIGKYDWMAENLRTTTYNDGEKIPNITDGEQWVKLNSGAFCWYDNDTSNAKLYGALYNWYSVNTNKLCPIGWRVPSDDDWRHLEGFVDSKYKYDHTEWNSLMSRGFDVGKRLKSTTCWISEGTGTDNYHFSALPGGERTSRKKYIAKGYNGFWWCSTEADSVGAWYRCIAFSIDRTFRNTHPKIIGFSVRCIKN